jgi:AraC-like DNA-binding protein
MIAIAGTSDRSRQTAARHRPLPVSVSVRSVRPVLGYLAGRGYDTATMLRDVGVDPAELNNSEARIPHASAVALWDTAKQLTGDACIGIHVAEAIRPGIFGALEYALRTSATLGKGVARLCRYHLVYHDVAEVALTIRGEHAILSHRLPLPGGAPRAIAEFILTGWLVVARQATGSECVPAEVRFPFPEPADTSDHQRVFRAPLCFNHERSELVWPKHVLDLPMLAADSMLQPIVEGQVRAALQNLPSGESAIDAVRGVLSQELCDGEPTLERVATRLHMSVRTLHRRLEDEGASFRRVLADARLELAERHLSDSRLAVGEIAFLLGFSEPSAFRRAFKRWTGLHPAAFRLARSGAGEPSTAR